MVFAAVFVLNTGKTVNMSGANIDGDTAQKKLTIALTDLTGGGLGDAIFVIRFLP